MSILSVGTIRSVAASTPPVVQDSAGTQVGTFCRAWVNFNGTGTVAIRAAFNVSSITDNGVGDYTVNFATAMPDVNYAVNGITGQTSSTSANMSVGIRSTSAIGDNSSISYLTTSIRVFTRAGGGSANDSDAVSVTVFR